MPYLVQYAIEHDMFYQVEVSDAIAKTLREDPRFEVHDNPRDDIAVMSRFKSDWTSEAIEEACRIRKIKRG